MKISYSNYPILEKLKKGNLGNIPIYEIDKENFNDASNIFVSQWNNNLKYFNSEINIISSSFYQSSLKASEKLLPLYGDIIKNFDFTVSGTFILGNEIHMIHHISDEVNKDKEKIIYYVFDKNGTPLMMLLNYEKDETFYSWVSNTFKVGKSSELRTKLIVSYFQYPILFHMFKSYAEVETKTLKPKERLKDIDCKYTNDTDFTVTHLDSKWFTTLVSSQGFKVRGFFRLQPKKKNGEWIKELIWIDEFEKQGYNRQAKILNQPL